MKKKHILYTVVLVLLVGLSVRTVDKVEHEKEKHRFTVEVELLKNQIRALEEELKLEKNKKDYKYYGGLLYHEVMDNEKTLFVSDESEILALPYEGAVSLRKIDSNTLVTVLDKVSAENEAQGSSIWYYVRIPVYDTPMDHTGWIRHGDVEEYNELNYLKLQSDVSVKIGSTIIESFEFPSFDEYDYSYTTEYEIRGRKEETRDGYVRISAAGGVDYWVGEENILYPQHVISSGDDLNE